VIAIVWEFVVRPERRDVFKKEYGPAGCWLKLFRPAHGFRGMTLLEDAANPFRFLTIDYWDDISSYSQFHRESAQEYGELDRKCEELTMTENRVGQFVVLGQSSP